MYSILSFWRGRLKIESKVILCSVSNKKVTSYPLSTFVDESSSILTYQRGFGAGARFKPCFSIYVQGDYGFRIASVSRLLENNCAIN